MKRRLIPLLLLLVGGAIVNVAVAWGCVLLNPPKSDVAALRVISSEDANAFFDPAFFRDLTIPSEVPGYTQTSLGWINRRVWWMLDQDINRMHMIGGDWTHAGWPAYCVSGGFRMDGRTGILETELVGAIVLPRWAQPDASGLTARIRMVPASPIWPGFAINTVFYAVLLWLLFATPFALRKRRRIKRGLCPKCAYHVGTNAVCTECGAAVSTVRTIKPRP